MNNAINEMYKTQKECAKNGHKSSSEWSSYDSGKMNGICENCSEMYERNPTIEERKKYLEIVRTPMTI